PGEASLRAHQRIVGPALALDEERLVQVGLVVGVHVRGPHRVAPEHHVAVVVLVHAQGELGVHGLAVKTPGLPERGVDQLLGNSVVHDDEEADVREGPADLGRRGGAGAGPRRQIGAQIDDGDHDDEIAFSDRFDNERVGSYGARVHGGEPWPTASSRSSTATSTSSSPPTCGPGTSTRPSVTGRPSVSRRTRAICGSPTPARRGGGAPAAPRVGTAVVRDVTTPSTSSAGSRTRNGAGRRRCSSRRWTSRASTSR